ASGSEKLDIVAGLHRAVAMRVAAMAQRLGVYGKTVFSGGVAKNIGVRTSLEDILGVRFEPLNIDPQILGALGAAVLAWEQHQNKR
ncbi:MAG: BadF/BadG/BcrA/BcrD ATPase family protein, partial [Pseudomonadota bacterium]